MFLGIEIGGTKLQLGVGHGHGGPLVELVRLEIDPRRGAAGILAQIERAGLDLVRRHVIQRIGIGFGGPVDGAAGRVLKSHQVSGWDDAPLADWCRQTLGVPAVLANDCDAAALAEARFGAGRAATTVFYVTVGTGIGGGLVINGRLHGSHRPAVAEIGHLRPGLHADRAEDTVESLASGPGIAAAAQAILSGRVSRPLARIRRQIGRPDKSRVREQLERIEEIAAVKGIDGWFIGPYDLSASMGKPGATTDPDVLEAIGRVKEAAIRAKVPLGIYCSTGEAAETCAGEGYAFLVVGIDTVLIAQTARQIAHRLKEATG